MRNFGDLPKQPISTIRFRPFSKNAFLFVSLVFVQCDIVLHAMLASLSDLVALLAMHVLALKVLQKSFSYSGALSHAEANSNCAFRFARAALHLLLKYRVPARRLKPQSLHSRVMSSCRLLMLQSVSTL